MDFNVDDNIKFIRECLPESAAELTDNSILEILDIICDYDSENDLFDISADPDIDVDDDECESKYRADLIAYVKKCVAKRRIPGLTDELSEKIVIAELDYEDSISDLI